MIATFGSWEEEGATEEAVVVLFKWVAVILGASCVLEAELF